MYKIFIYRVISLIALVLLISGWVLNFSPKLFSFAVIALSLGLRHGLDADHIVAIDNITRKLAVEKKSSLTTGLYFALGHSTIVFALTATLILGISNSHAFYSKLSVIGDKVGGLISISFLCMTIVMNLIAFKNIKHAPQTNYPGFIFRLANKYLFNAIDRPEKMFLVGFFFGLGFDTATEIGLLSLAASSMINGINPSFILLLPVLFACGMIFTDTLNSVFMSNIYRLIKERSQNIYLYNYMVIGFATLATLTVIIIESINYFNEQLPYSNFLFKLVNKLNDNTCLLGAVIISIFIILWISAHTQLSRKNKQA